MPVVCKRRFILTCIINLDSLERGAQLGLRLGLGLGLRLRLGLDPHESDSHDISQIHIAYANLRASLRASLKADGKTRP